MCVTEECVFRSYCILDSENAASENAGALESDSIDRALIMKLAFKPVR